jgi:Coenzyme PQQ synthesis protein D (PqqD)
MKSSFRSRRSSAALVRPLRDEIIVYQKESFHVHALNSTAVEVWKLADRTRTVAEIARLHTVDLLHSNRFGAGKVPLRRISWGAKK